LRQSSAVKEDILGRIGVAGHNGKAVTFGKVEELNLGFDPLNTIEFVVFALDLFDVEQFRDNEPLGPFFEQDFNARPLLKPAFTALDQDARMQERVCLCFTGGYKTEPFSRVKPFNDCWHSCRLIGDH